MDLEGKNFLNLYTKINEEHCVINEDELVVNIIISKRARTNHIRGNKWLTYCIK